MKTLNKENNKNKALVSLAQETYDIIQQGYYIAPNGNNIKFQDQIDDAVNYSVYYDNEPVELYEVPEIQLNPKFEVINETTAQGAQRLLGQGLTDLVALNFASAKNPGGGWLRGAKAQEEDLARCSGLYHCLVAQVDFYNDNLICGSNLYTDGIIYSPEIPFFRDINLNKLNAIFPLSIITCPAPNAAYIKDNEKKLLYSTLQRRAVKILKVAAQNNHRNIILGAWGCGVFANDYAQVANAFLSAWKEVPYFDHVCFSVYDTSPNQLTFNTFKEIIK